MTAKNPSFSKHRRIIQNQKLIEIFAVLAGITACSTPVWIVLLLPYVKVLLALWVLAIFVCVIVDFWEQKSPKA